MNTKEKLKGKWKWAAGVCILTLLAVYGIGCYYFSCHYYYGTVIDGTVCGCMTEEQVKREYALWNEQYELTVYGRSRISDVLRGKDAGVAVKPETGLQNILNCQRYLLWPVSFFEPHVYELTDIVQVDEERLREAAKNLALFDYKLIQRPMSAYLSDYYAPIKGYFIVPEVEGNHIRREDALAAIRDAFLNRETELSLEGDEWYYEPILRSDDARLVREAEQRNAYTNLVITYDMRGEEVVLDGDRIHEWLTEENGSVKIDEEQVSAFIKELADTYNTRRGEWLFRTAKGELKTVRTGGYGWKLDEKAEQEALLAIFQHGNNARRNPKWKSKGSEEVDVGSTYVEIDLGAQHLYLVKKGRVVLESDLVSGNVATGCTTPPGVFRLRYKTRNAVLRGADYASPVSYWMPFNRGIGLHDATWRSTFGGTIYKTNGSHGCINLPLNKAKEIYNFVETNMPVVCYY